MYQTFFIYGKLYFLDFSGSFFCMDYECMVCMVYDMDCMVLLYLWIYGCISLENVRGITVLGK
jgi:hypothetical protein